MTDLVPGRVRACTSELSVAPTLPRMTMVVVLKELAMTVSEKFKVSIPLLRSSENDSSTGLVVSMVYSAACWASKPFLSGCIGRSNMSIIP